ncbi:MAG: tetratricopeptide repeat protein [Terriglobia bacterium]
MKMSFVSRRFPFFSVPLCLCAGSSFAIISHLLPAQDSEQAAGDQIAENITLGHTDEALDEARGAVKQFPNSSRLQQLFGVALFKKGLNDEARQTLRRAIELDPGISENYYNLALVDLSERRYDAAAVSLEGALHRDPPNPAEVHLLLGRAYQNLNRTEPAIDQFKQALALEPRLPLAHYHLGFAYHSQGDQGAALGEFEKEIKITPAFYDSYWLGGNIQLDRGDLKRAEDLFRRGIRLQPESVPAHYGLARVLLARKDLPAAETELLKALELNPNDVEAHYTLARTYQQMGRLEAAQRELETVAALHERQRRALSGIAAQH